ncbi:MAG: sensor histidine kinase, partial [Bacteroidota bacterium]
RLLINLNKLNNLRLQSKVILLSVVSILFSTGLVGLVAFNISTRVIERNAYKQINETIQQSANYLNEKLINMLRNIHNVLTNESFRTSIQNLTDQSTDPIGEFSRQERLLSQLRFNNPLIESVYVYTPKIIFFDTTKGRIDRSRFTESQIYRKLIQESFIYWGVSGEVEWLTRTKEVIPVVMRTGIENINPEAALVIVHLKASEIIQYLSELRNRFVAETYLVNSSGQIVTNGYESDYRLIFKNLDFKNRIKGESNYFRYQVNGRKVLVNFTTLRVNGWKLVTITPEKQLLGDIEHIKWMTLIVGMLLIGVTSGLSVLVSKSITSPLYQLQLVMKRVRNREITARFEPRYDDEIGELGRNFNLMLDEIDLLITRLHEEQEKLKTEQKLKQAAELKVLQSQINPHFLYNTLDSIYWKSMLGGNEQVAKMIVSLAKFSRFGLSKGQGEVTIDQELQHVENYLYLQKSIYEGKFDYCFEVDPEVKGGRILKFILQPLAENSILHGFNDLKKGGKIIVRAVIENGQICIEVIDNGKGFDVSEIQKSLVVDDGIDGSGYALSNINQRLKLRYGNECLLELSSIPYQETVVRINVPFIREVQDV